MIKVSF